MTRKSLLLFYLIAFPWGVISQTIDSTETDKHVLLTDRFIVEAAFFSNSKSVVFKVDGNLPSRPIDFGETLGLNRQGNTVDFNFIWRFSKQNKWYVNLNYFAVRNDQSVILEDVVKWGDSEYPAGIILDSGFDVDMFRIFFGRVISMGKKHELSAGFGLHAMNIRTYIQGSAFLGNVGLTFDPERKRVKVLAPVPNIGIRYVYTPFNRLALAARAEWFSLSIGDYKGLLWDISPSVYYQLFDNIGVGLSYKYFKAKVDMNRNVWNGSADLLYQGPLFSITGNF
jgi:hypothetical protein